MFSQIKLNNKELETKILEEEEIENCKRKIIIHHGMERMRWFYSKFIKSNGLENLHYNSTPMNMKMGFFNGGKLHLRMVIRLNNDVKHDKKFILTLLFKEKSRLKEELTCILKYGEDCITLSDRFKFSYEEHTLAESIIGQLQFKKTGLKAWYE